MHFLLKNVTFLLYYAPSFTKPLISSNRVFNLDQFIHFLYLPKTTWNRVEVEIIRAAISSSKNLSREVYIDVNEIQTFYRWRVTLSPSRLSHAVRIVTQLRDNITVLFFFLFFSGYLVYIITSKKKKYKAKRVIDTHIQYSSAGRLTRSVKKKKKSSIKQKQLKTSPKPII